MTNKEKKRKAAQAEKEILEEAAMAKALADSLASKGLISPKGTNKANDTSVEKNSPTTPPDSDDDDDDDEKINDDDDEPSPTLAAEGEDEDPSSTQAKELERLRKEISRLKSRNVNLKESNSKLSEKKRKKSEDDEPSEDESVRNKRLQTNTIVVSAQKQINRLQLTSKTLSHKAVQAWCKEIFLILAQILRKIGLLSGF